jgi:serine/threonine-protein kinase
MMPAGGEPEGGVEALQGAAASHSFGKYQLFASLGRGGMADVFLAVARGPMGFNKLVVLKRLRSALADETAFRNMFLDEAKLAARLNHPNIVHTYEVGEQGGNYFIAMEYLEGQSLNKVMKESIKAADVLEPVYCARIVADALAGLSHAHTLKDYDGRPLNIIHRDVSPHNIFCTYEGHIKLVDFGIAKAALSSTETEVGVLKGKVAYMSPEQAMGGPIDQRADIFAMGIVLWELLTRQRLMTGESAANTLHRLLNVPIQRPSTVVPGIPPALDDIAMRALEKDPNRRFQSAAEMRDALEKWMASIGVVVRQEEVGRRVARLFQKTRDEVQRQIQRHMAAIGGASNTQELRALTMESLQRMEKSGANISGQLLRLGTGSGSGSGVVSNFPPAGTQAPPGRAGTLLPLLLAAFFGMAFVVVLVVAFKSALFGPGKTNAGGSTSATTSSAGPAPTETSKVDPQVTSTGATTGTTGTPSSPPASATSTPTNVAPTAPPPTARPTAKPTGTVASTRPTATEHPKPPPTVPTASEEMGYLTFDTYPYSTCSENGRPLGGTPLRRLALTPGPHTFTCETEQGQKKSWTVTVKSGENPGRRFEFTAQ